MQFLEKNQRLSNSILWKLQREAYTQFGPHAWSHKGVPFYITSNPYTVKQYAQTVLGYIRDCLSPNAKTPIDTSLPLYVLDLGAGTGRFGYLFIHILIDLLNTPEFRNVKIRYVMTDIAEKNIAFWQEHSYLKPLVQEGFLDFAFYDASQTDPIQLINSKITLSKENLHNPLILIANYFFDTIPQDLFQVKDGHLLEGNISIQVDPNLVEGELTPENPNIIPKMQCEYSYSVLANNSQYFSEPLLNEELKKYSNLFENATFLYPSGALKSLNYFSELSQNRLFVIAGDQGLSSMEQVLASKEPSLARHGTFSIAVNYDAIAHYFEQNNGCSCRTTFPEHHFIVIAGILGGNCDHYQNMQQAFSQHVDSFEPCDYWRLINQIEEGFKNPSLDLIYLLLKWGNWDPMVFNDYYPQLLQELPKATPEIKSQFKLVIGKVWRNFYPVSADEGAFIMNLGVLLHQMQEYQEAMTYYNQALKVMGKHPQLLQNLMACYQALTKQ